MEFILISPKPKLHTHNVTKMDLTVCVRVTGNPEPRNNYYYYYTIWMSLVTGLLLLLLLLLLLFTAIGLLPGGSGYFTCKQT